VRPNNIIWWRINEATGFMKLFKSDKNPELWNPRGIPRKIKSMLEIRRVKCN
jgi:hypothetical protein